MRKRKQQKKIIETNLPLGLFFFVMEFKEIFVCIAFDENVVNDVNMCRDNGEMVAGVRERLIG
jgi:hypothetical protein